mmetsp:Transcript_35559/g.59946  ORF Transcript_35559/g.59946 Transcript_35559/m.59946 type:complete len:334 (+) Transcript_35559:213-1214(+)|eukprot:CAMPEP_0198212774 /NCGR_PEP_ID=MMETSP1445-20131203/27586_1 /TAXON_ID=36898 /ORGANISM="Pyramimonas sp., Strain CCMP2087" /LENGTH=333 /DNA_ID=CAMNT_0043887307 /DNA_START=185 /DNA_END=1186 /DNA_ORIENTATION=-
MSKTAEGNVGLAFLFVFLAGLSTTIGSTFAFCSNLADQRFLASALGCSAGVMLYVSFGEIFMVKSVGAFEEHGFSDAKAMRFATFCFFGGIFFTAMLDKLVHFIAECSGQMPGHDHSLAETQQNPNMSVNPLAAGHELPQTQSMQELVPGQSLEDGSVSREMALDCDENNGFEKEEAKKKSELQKMGLMTGIAIGLHNFPEGLATFVATLADAHVGGAIALAIALHNIPEGVCVAMPIYYATGSRWKGFWWSVMSGISEPIGGLVGYLVLYGDNMSEIAYGSLFGAVGGMMVYISIVELIPTALKYDPQDKYVTVSLLVGMAVMAASLLLFAV